MPHCCWGPHCPYHHCHHGYWAGPFPPGPVYAPPPPPPQAYPSRDDYARRVEAERDALEGRLRRIEEQLAELLRRERTG